MFRIMKTEKKKGLLFLVLSALIGIGGVSAFAGGTNASPIDEAKAVTSTNTSTINSKALGYSGSQIMGEVNATIDNFLDVSISGGTVMSSQFRVNVAQNLTISIATGYEGTITQVDFVTGTYSSESSSDAGVEALSTETGTYTYDSSESTGTWTGEASSIVFRANKYVYIASAIVTYTTDIDPVTGVTLDETSVSVEASKTVQLTATVSSSGTKYVPGVTWSSSDEAVATVSDGLVTGIAVGTATITATSKGYQSDGTQATASCEVTVTEATGATYYYSFRQIAFDANNQTKTLGDIDWTVSGEYDGDGSWWFHPTKGQQFGGVGAGYYTSLVLFTSGTGVPGIVTSIKVNTSGYSDIDATMEVTVGGEAFGSQITLTDTASVYTFTGSKTGRVALSYTNSSALPIYIKSIEIEYLFYSDATSLTVTPETDQEIYIGKTTTFAATVAPENTANPYVTWSTSDEAVATVSEGIVTGVAEGTATITATTVGTDSSGNNVSVTRTVTVTKPDKTLTGITVDTASIRTMYYLGDQIDYSGIIVTATYDNDTSETIDKSSLEFYPEEGTYVTMEDMEKGNITVTVVYTDDTATVTTFVPLNVYQTTNYTKVTSSSDLEIGASYTLGYEPGDGTVIPIAAKGANTYYASGTALHLDGNVFADTDGILDFTLAPGRSSSTYALWSDREGGYIYGNGEATSYIEGTLSKYGDLTISVADGETTIKSNGYIFGYDSSSSAFSFSTNSSLAKVSLYKRSSAELSYYTHATMWASRFLSSTSYYCNNYGQIAESGNWEWIASYYALDTWSYGISLETQVEKDFILRGIAKEGGNTIEDALARYDYCVATYGLTDFLGRNPTTSGSQYRSSLVSDDASSYIAILAVAGGAVLAGGLFFAIKRKASREEE